MSRQSRGGVEPPKCKIPYVVEGASGVANSGIPVFQPTWEQFKRFDLFVQEVHAVGAFFGLMKVKPPPEHTPNRSKYQDKDIQTMFVHTPVVQHVHSVSGLTGAYQVRNVFRDEAHSDVTVAEFEALATKEEAGRSLREKKMVEEKDWDGLKKRFWSSTLTNPPLYGADSPGTLFDTDYEVWNVSQLPSLLHVQERGVAGVSLPMLYWGAPRSMFSWHIEDVNLYSINYLHFGAPKQWYAIRPDHAEKFEAAMRNIYASCIPHGCPREFLRHKEYLVSPNLLRAKYGVDVMEMRQEQGEYIVLWPKCYHSGFNYGFNCAESVNFATSAWLAIGRACGRCLCRDSSVWIDSTDLANRVRQLQWLTKNNDNSKKKFTIADVPSEYKLQESLWCDLPANPIELRALVAEYFGQADSMRDAAAPAGRSMGRAMGSAPSTHSDVFSPEMLNRMETENSDSEPDEGYLADRNAIWCEYDNCHAGLMKDHAALQEHWRTAHSAGARAAAATSAAQGSTPDVEMETEKSKLKAKKRKVEDTTTAASKNPTKQVALPAQLVSKKPKAKQ